MSVATKLAKAKRLGIEFAEGYTPKSEEELDKLIEAKQEIVGQQKEEEKILKQQRKRAEEDARKNQIILKDVDGDDVEQSEYFWPRLVKETVNEKTPNEKTFDPTDQTAPVYFNKICGVPVDREELIDVFVQFFPRKKGFLFYKVRDREVYLVIVPLKYAKTISASNESRPGDFQRHALSFISEGSVNIDSLKLKLERISKHSSISTEPISR
jgi:hypothetical protein